MRRGRKDESRERLRGSGGGSWCGIRPPPLDARPRARAEIVRSRDMFDGAAPRSARWARATGGGTREVGRGSLPRAHLARASEGHSQVQVPRRRARASVVR